MFDLIWLNFLVFFRFFSKDIMKKLLVKNKWNIHKSQLNYHG